MSKQKDFFDKFSEFLKDIDLLKSFIPPVHKAGYPFIILFIVYYYITFLFLILLFFNFFFKIFFN